MNRLAAGWAATVPPQHLVFVNVHPAQLAETDLLEAFGPLLPHARRVVLEITERADLHAVPDGERAQTTPGDADSQRAGDDLGAGHNGLKLLADLKPAFIKIDAGIVRHVDREPRKQRLIEMLAGFAASTGARLVAEVVETAAEADALALARTGAHLLQGYYFGCPALF
ncbi:MAG: EAL domain-containing protein, partial [Armatimonadota bacterium]|nr:EAL domain-containing protein [Armatimonadota bacterium]